MVKHYYFGVFIVILT